MTTQDDIRRWFEEGKRLGATHLLVVCDTFDWEDYPVYVTTEGRESALVTKTTNVQEFVKKNYTGKNMQKTIEVYKLSDPMEEQIAQDRCFRY